MTTDTTRKPAAQPPGPNSIDSSKATWAAALGALEHTREAVVCLQDICNDLEADALRARDEADHWRNVAATASQQNSQSHDLLNRLHQYRGGDLPTQILHICMELTGAEQGLFTSPNGDTSEANVGLDALTHVPTAALLAFTRQAVEKDRPVVENNGMALPDGPQLVNLAAVPVSLHDTPAGVLLVANKRNGPFTEADTDTLLAVGHHASTAIQNRRLRDELQDAFHGTVAVLADAIMAKDPYTHGHSEDVSELTLQVARRLGIEGEELHNLRYAALLHDIGKIAVPDGILMKPGALTKEERALIERHPQVGADMIQHVASLRAVAPIVRHHHEKINGTGYPDGLAGEAIPLPSRIIAVVDALNAMTTLRPYRLPLANVDAIEELRRCAGIQFDSRVVAAVEELYRQPQSVVNPPASV